MTRIQPAEIPGATIFNRTLGRAPDIMEANATLDATIRFSSRLSQELKEEVRRSTAGGIGCEFCASLGEPKPEHIDRAEALAVAFAQMIIEDPNNIDDSVFDVLREEFSEEQIVELTAWICFILIGNQTFGAVMRLPAATQEELDSYTAWRAEGARLTT